MPQIVLSGGTHAALRTARRRGKPRLRVLVAAGAGPWPAPDSALRSRFPVCRVRRAARMVRWRSMCPAAVPRSAGSECARGERRYHLKMARGLSPASHPESRTTRGPVRHSAEGQW